MLALAGICKRFGDKEVLRNVALEVSAREFVAVVGPSGCGKTTLLRLIAGLEEVSGGTIDIDGIRVNDVPAAKRRVAMVFQDLALYPHMTVAENIAFSLRLRGIRRRERLAIIRDVAQTLQLSDLLDRKPGELSGGQSQRVAIGRAIVQNPKLFLFDEPLSDLDAPLRGDMRREIHRLVKMKGTATLYVTHDQAEAMALADRVVVISDEGIVQQTGPPLEIYSRPVNKLVARFFGMPRMNFIPAVIVAIEGDGMIVEVLDSLRMRLPLLGDELAPGEAVTLGVRPENLQLSDDGTIAGKVEFVERLGSETFVHLNMKDDFTIVVRALGCYDVKVNDVASVAIDRNRCQLFKASGMAVGIGRPFL
jgi:multiple sugar transport system ATP-binding protein